MDAAVGASGQVPVGAEELIRWSEALAGIARTGLGFTESAYERERYEEILEVASDIKAAVSADPDTAVGHREEWMKIVGRGVAGYVTPKVAVGAVVGEWVGSSAGLGYLMLGSKAEQIVRLCPVPVTVVKAPQEPHKSK